MASDPSLVNRKQLRDLNAKIEELQQESNRNKAMMKVERRFREQEREIASLKRRNTDSSRASGSGAKQLKKAEKATIVKKQAAIITTPVVINTSTTEENLTTPAVTQPITNTVDEVIEVEKDLEDSSTAGQHHICFQR